MHHHVSNVSWPHSWSEFWETVLVYRTVLYPGESIFDHDTFTYIAVVFTYIAMISREFVCIMVFPPHLCVRTPRKSQWEIEEQSLYREQLLSLGYLVTYHHPIAEFAIIWRDMLLTLLSCEEIFQLVQERKAAIIRAEGESESARLISEATKAAGGGMIELRRIEAAKDVASTLSKSGNVVYLPSGNQMLLGLNSARWSQHCP